MEVKRTERGWAGHFICADRCRFRRNTLLEYKDIKIVVSSVGLLTTDDKSFDTVGLDRYFETMAFHSKKDDDRFNDIDVQKQVYFNSDWYISVVDADDKANIMHDVVVDEITNGLLSGNKYIEESQ